MNVAKLSHAELADAVSRLCAQFGAVGEITILQPTDKPQVAFALVAMKSAAAIDRVVDSLGAARVESLAVIRVEQAPDESVMPDDPAPALQRAPLALA
ncbi:MAG: RNA-binding protein [Betaproteobacteria bacterium]